MTAVALVSEHASPLAALGGADAGGQNVYVACLAAALTRLGHHVTVHTRRDDPDLPALVMTRQGYAVRHIDAGPATPVDKDELWPDMEQFAEQLGRGLERERPDVVHSHFWMSGWASLVAARHVDAPLVHTFHALGAVKQRHQGTADRSPADRQSVECLLLGAVDRVVATCHDEVQELIALGGDRRRISIVPCGYDEATFRPDGPARARTTRRRIGCVSRLVPRKGIADAVVALTDMPDVELVVAGGPRAPHHLEDATARDILRLARDLGVADRVQLLGGLDPAGVAEVVRSCDVLVAAPWYEPFGIAPVEAMACGVPVVGSAVGGLLDTVVDGGTGLLVPPRDPAAISRAVMWLLADRERLAEFGARAAWRAQRKFSWPVVARSMAAVYAQVCASRTTLESHA